MLTLLAPHTPRARTTSRGSIVVGKLADFAVLSQDIFHIDPVEIANVKVVLAAVGGEIVKQ